MSRWGGIVALGEKRGCCDSGEDELSEISYDYLTFLCCMRLNLTVFSVRFSDLVLC